MIEHPTVIQLRRDGKRVLNRWVDGAVLWCLDSDCEASQKDSYGDCADCGGPVAWVVGAR